MKIQLFVRHFCMQYLLLTYLSSLLSSHCLQKMVEHVYQARSFESFWIYGDRMRKYMNDQVCTARMLSTQYLMMKKKNNSSKLPRYVKPFLDEMRLRQHSSQCSDVQNSDNFRKLRWLQKRGLVLCGNILLSMNFKDL